MYTSELTKYSPRTEIANTSRILVVEDEELIREMLIVALEEEGYGVVTASDGRTALEYLKILKPTLESLFLTWLFLI